MKGEALWPYALEIYGRPGVEALLVELQDAHGQSVPYLLWSLWMAAAGRAADEAALARAAELARAWDAAAVTPLRALRRGLKTPGPAAQLRQRARLRDKVKGLELEAERMLFTMLEQASPTAPGEVEPRIALQRAADAWGAPAPGEALERLARAAR